MVLIRFWMSLTKKDRVLDNRYELLHFLSTFTLVLGRLYH